MSRDLLMELTAQHTISNFPLLTAVGGEKLQKFHSKYMGMIHTSFQIYGP
jgi:hypothetical protein